MKGIVGKTIAFLLGFSLGLLPALLYSISTVKYNAELIHPRQLETQIKHDLKDGRGKEFWISGTNIKITSRKDGSGVIRVIK